MLQREKELRVAQRWALQRSQPLERQVLLLRRQVAEETEECRQG